MSDWNNGVQYGIPELAKIKDKHNAMILQIDEFFKVAKEVGFSHPVIDDLQEMYEKLQSNVEIVNKQIETQKV